MQGGLVMSYSNVKKQVSVKRQLIYGLIATICAVVLPQLAHMLGRLWGVETKIGEMLLPMHLPIIFIGMIAGPIAGAVAGVASPLISFALTGMPKAVMLPFILIEVAVYGITAGLLYSSKINNFFKLAITHVAGRAVKAVAILIAFYFLNGKVAPSVIWTTLYTGLAGIVIQWLTLPFLAKKAI